LKAHSAYRLAAVPYHWGRYRGIAQDLKKPLLKDHLLNNVFFDTCVYHQPGIDVLFKVIPIDNILFASEMVGAVRGIDPETGNYYDDTKRYVEALRLSDEDRRKVFEGNARRVYSRLKNKIPASRLGDDQWLTFRGSTASSRLWSRARLPSWASPRDIENRHRSRQLAFDGVAFEMEHAPMSPRCSATRSSTC